MCQITINHLKGMEKTRSLVVPNIKIKYLIESEQDSGWGLMTSCVGHQEVRPGESYPPGDHPSGYTFDCGKGRVLSEYQLLYIVKGRGFFESKHCSRTAVSAGSMFLLFPGEWHNYAPDKETGWEEYWIGFNGKNIDEKVINGFFDISNPVYQIGLLEDIISGYESAIDVALKMKAGYQQMLAGLVNIFLGTCYYHHLSNQQIDSRDDEAIQQARTYMSAHFCEEITPEMVAAKVNMGYSKFRKLFKEISGYAPMQYILELRLRHSCELLTTTDKSIAEISMVLGYDSTISFINAFKNKYGSTPLKYRQKCLSNFDKI